MRTFWVAQQDVEYHGRRTCASLRSAGVVEHLSSRSPRIELLDACPRCVRLVPATDAPRLRLVPASASARPGVTFTDWAARHPVHGVVDVPDAENVVDLGARRQDRQAPAIVTI